MRVRLLIDIDMNPEDIESLQTMIREQPLTDIIIKSSWFLYGRLMGATPVEGGPE